VGEVFLLGFGEPGEEVDAADGADPALELAVAHLLAVGLVLLHQVDGLVAHREADAFALQRGEDVVADVGVGDVVGARVDQPVAQLVAGVAVAERRQQADGRRAEADVGDAGGLDVVEHGAGDAGRRHREVHVEVDQPALLRHRLARVAHHHVAVLHQVAVGDHHPLAVAGDDGGVAPLDVADLARHVADLDPVADLEGVVHLQREAAQQVAEGVLHRDGEHRGEHRRGGEQVGELDAGQVEPQEAPGDVADDHQDVGEDAGDVHAQRGSTTSKRASPGSG
jgi:hypothetical protein